MRQDNIERGDAKMKKNGKQSFLTYVKQEFKPLISIFYNKKDLVYLFSFVAGTLCMLFGALAILGWHTHNYMLYQIRSDFTPMYYNTAICFLFLGGGLSLHSTHYRKLASIMGVAVVGLSGLVLSQYIFNTNLGIDELFFRSNVSIHTSSPGRMSYNSSISFLACGISLILLSFKKPSAFAYYIVLLLAIAGFVFGLTSLIGYAAQLPDTYLWSKLTPMSLLSTIGIMLASGGIIASVYIKSVSREINLTANLPYLAVFFVFCLTSLLWNASLQEGIERVYEITTLEGDKIQKVVIKTLDESISDLQELAAHLAMFPKITENVWKNSVEYYRNKNAFYESIKLIDSSYAVLNISPLQGHEFQLRHKLNSQSFLQNDLDIVKKKRAVRISPIDDSLLGESRVYICIPFFDKASFKGYIIATVNVHKMLSSILTKDEDSSKFEIAFYTNKERERNFYWTQGRFYQDIYSSKEIRVYNTHWLVDVWPSSDLLNQYKYTLLSKLIVLIGIFTALLLFSSIRARQLIKKQAQMLQKTKNNLEVQLHESSRHTQELRLIKDMTDAVQACTSLKEAAEIIAKFCKFILPSTRGEIYLSNAAQTKLKHFTFWGHEKCKATSFFSKDCLCIHQKAISYISGGVYGKVCKHYSSSSSFYEHNHVTHYCIPFYEHDVLLGILTIQDQSKSQHAAKEQKKLISLLEMFANQISLCISSIKLRDRLKDQAIRDPLTNLYNRRYLEESLQRELYRAHRYAQPVSLIMVDIDHFKKINDTYGHEAGDYVLKNVAQILQKHYRKSDMACRFGGEEFILVLPQMTRDVALQRAEKIREAVEALNLTYHGKKIKKVTTSLGVSSFPQHGYSSHDLISAADKALYKAKKSGRNCVQVAEINSKLSSVAKLEVVN